MLTTRFSFILRQKLNDVCFRYNSSHWFIQSRAYGVYHEMKQYTWREKEEALETFKMSDDPEKPKSFLWYPTNAPSHPTFSFINIGTWYRYYKEKTLKEQQRFIPERHEILGPDLATAHFIVCRGGRVRFRGDTYWTEKNEKDEYDLPNKFNPQYVIEALDVNGYNLYYDGMSNLCSLIYLKWLSFKDCKNIDDWCLDKISAEFPELEYLDISGCKRITERGLESLYRMSKLKTLIVTNYNSVVFELTCMMLEDCMPGLICKIHTPEEISKK